VSTRQAQFRTWIEIAKPTLKKDAMSFLQDAAKSNKDLGLIVTTKASYSGYLLNGRCYPGIHMEQGIPTWCSHDNGGSSPYDMPVLMFHDPKLPAIGRVVQASYHRLAKNDVFFADWKNPARGLELGSGYTLLKLGIQDKDAQEKFLDGRYATFSTSFSSPYTGCSICERNLLEENCDHVVGEVYELEDGTERECYLVTGAQFNREVSVVNHPAQPFAVAEEIKWADAKAALNDVHFDSARLAREFEFNRGIIQVKTSPSLMLVDGSGNSTALTLREGERDAIPSRGNGGIKLPVSVRVPDLSAPKAPPVDSDPNGLGDDDWAMGHIVSGLIKRGLLLPDSELKDVCVIGEGKALFFSGLTEEGAGHLHSVWLEVDIASKRVTGWTDGTYPVDEKSEVSPHRHTVDFILDDLNADRWALETRESDFGETHIHDVDVAIARDAMYIPTLQECNELARRFEASVQSDAKLSSERREKLKATSFCGPGRSFPVPDCAHVTAARRLIGRYKGDADAKKRIMACVNGRAAKMGCGSSDRDAGHEPEHHEDTTMSTPTPAPSGAAPATPATPAAPAASATNEDTVKVLTESLKKEQDRNRELQSAHDSAKSEATALQTKLTDAEKNLHRTRCDHLALLRALNGEKPSGHKLDSAEGLKAYVDGELVKRTPDSVTDAIRDESSKLESKLPSLKGLGAFVQDRSQARDAGAATQKVDETPGGAKKPEPKQPTKAKDLV